jgi:hypothetical protein
VIDPTDAWFGLRSSPDGRSTGYPIAVFGGDHGDVLLEPGGGAVLAEAIVRERFSAIICTETMTKGEELRFVGDFLETLYRKNREAMHLFIDESDLFAPQAPYGVEARTCGATDDIVRRGRKKGIGCTLITQRASVINKNVLSQADMLVALGCSHPLDLEAIEKWVRKNADPELAKEMMASLPSLPRGEAWVWNPSQHLFKRVAIRQRRTFDSGATPKAGEKKREPKILAPVDIARLGQAMADTVQRQRENDPKELKKQVLDLRRKLERVGEGQDRAELRPLSVLKRDDLDRLEKIVARADVVLNKHDAAVSRHHQAYQAALEGYTRTSKAVTSAAIAALDELRVKIRPALAEMSLEELQANKLSSPSNLRISDPHARGTDPEASVGDGPFSKCERTLLIVLAQHPRGLSRKQALIFSGYRHSGTTTTAFAHLLADRVVESRAGRLVATP